jgi:hypothetical protein
LETARFDSNSEVGTKLKELQRSYQKIRPPFYFGAKPLAIQSRFQGVPENRMEGLRDLVKVWLPRQEQKTSN